MQKISLIAVLIVACAGAAYAVPMRTLEYGTVPQREYTPTQDECLLRYYNICSGWLLYWTAYCYVFDFNQPMFGTCFDLADCPAECRNLEDVWFACRLFVFWGTIDVEIYCADEYSCPVGLPLAGAYGYPLSTPPIWQHLNFGGLPLCTCEEGTGRFIVMITEPWAGIHDAPYSDVNSTNINVGCETEWRCTGHSYVYRNVTDYCELYGVPGPLLRVDEDYGCTGSPPLPPACGDVTNFFYAEWLIDCYLSCEGPTAADKTSWSEIKGLYK